VRYSNSESVREQVGFLRRQFLQDGDLPFTEAPRRDETQDGARSYRDLSAIRVSDLSRLLRLTWAHRSIIPVQIGGIRNARSWAGPDRPSAQLNLNQKATYWGREPIDSDELVLKLQRYCA